jgi:hypothetical protein
VRIIDTTEHHPRTDRIGGATAVRIIDTTEHHPRTGPPRAPARASALVVAIDLSPVAEEGG